MKDIKREIKFRAWLKDKQVMKKIRSIEWAGIEVSSGFIKHIDTVNDRYYSKDYNDKGNYILMQYTGLKDANGKEIYEGDIVVEAYKGESSICLTTFEKKPLKSGTYEVKWNKIGFNLGSEDGRDYEVIGNIYENPELLERN